MLIFSPFLFHIPMVLSSLIVKIKESEKVFKLKMFFLCAFFEKKFFSFFDQKFKILFPLIVIIFFSSKKIALFTFSLCSKTFLISPFKSHKITFLSLLALIIKFVSFANSTL